MHDKLKVIIVEGLFHKILFFYHWWYLKDTKGFKYQRYKQTDIAKINYIMMNSVLNQLVQHYVLSELPELLQVFWDFWVLLSKKTLLNQLLHNKASERQYGRICERMYGLHSCSRFRNKQVHIRPNVRYEHRKF